MGRAGSRCAICNSELTHLDGLDSIVGDEAHIRSRKPSGPRHEPDYPVEMVDTYANLILLCKAHHKLVDDNWVVFPSEALEEIKRNHEHRVKESLTNEASDWVEDPDVRRLETGTELANIVMSASAYVMGNDHPGDEEEATIISALLQEAQDWGDIAGDVGQRGRVDAAMSLHSQLEDLAARGFAVVGGLGRYRIARGLIVPTAFVRIVRVAAPQGEDGFAGAAQGAADE
ncbi:MAG: hypothetical protein QOK43_2998 [Acidimicrobiaceae bacterium]|nr:hypothetical protein [Acidimicrobiaceae bacterium]